MKNQNLTQACRKCGAAIKVALPAGLERVEIRCPKCGKVSRYDTRPVARVGNPKPFLVHVNRNKIEIDLKNIETFKSSLREGDEITVPTKGGGTLTFTAVRISPYYHNFGFDRTRKEVVFACKSPAKMAAYGAVKTELKAILKTLPKGLQDAIIPRITADGKKPVAEKLWLFGRRDIRRIPGWNTPEGRVKFLDASAPAKWWLAPSTNAKAQWYVTEFGQYEAVEPDDLKEEKGIIFGFTL